MEDGTLFVCSNPPDFGGGTPVSWGTMRADIAALFGARQGAPGKPGTQWRAGAVAPPAKLGCDGDFYLNTITTAISQKVKGKYAQVCALAPRASRNSSTLLHRAT